MNQTNTNQTGDNSSLSHKKKRNFPHESAIMGMFWVLCGLLLLVHNIVELSTPYILLILFFFSAYLIILSILRRIRKIYFVMGLVLVSFFLSILVIEYGQSQLRWPIIMIVLSVGITIYGLLFKVHSRIKYIIPGVFLLGISILVLLSAISSEKLLLSNLLYKFWPILLIFLGGYQIRGLLLKKKIARSQGQLDSNMDVVEGKNNSENSTKN